MLELRQLRYFSAVAEFGSIAKAAEALHMTQPSLSRQLSQLEREVGFKLIVRKHRGSTLTAAGRGLQAHLPLVMGQLERIPIALAAADEEAHLLHLGVPPGIPYEWFNSFAERLSNMPVKVVLSLFEATSEQQMQMVRQGLIDIGLVHAKPRNLPSRRILSQRMGCVFLSEPREPSDDGLTLRDLRGLRVMAQSTPVEQTRLRARADWEDADVDWMFRNYSHHGQLIARTSGVDAILATEATASKDFAGLPWIQIASTETVAYLGTWACWRDPQLSHLQLCLDAMRVADDQEVSEPAPTPTT